MSDRAKFEVVLLDKITDPARPLRMDLTPESVEELAKSIALVGLIEPLVLKKHNGTYEVIAGHRRLLACQIADLVEVPGYVLDATDEEADLIKLHENLHRTNISPIEESQYFHYLTKQYGWEAKKIASLIGKSEAYVYARLAIDEYPDDILLALEAGKITIGVARELADIDDETQRTEYLDYAIRNGITTDVAAEWKRQYKAQKAGAEKRGTVEPTVPTRAPTSILTIECVLCNGQVPMREAKIVYTHSACLAKFQAAT